MKNTFVFIWHKMRMTGWLSCVVFILLLTEAGIAQNTVPAHQHEHSSPSVEVKAQPLETNLQVPDVKLLNQNGDTVDVVKDLLNARTVVINFVFTTCTTVCPPMGATYAKLQKLLAEAGLTEVQLISISVDPVTDTPERLKAWAAKFGQGPSRPAWTLLTGDKSEVDKLLRALGGLSARKEDHTPMLLIGNVSQGYWMRAYGLAKPTELLALVQKVAAHKVASINPEKSNESRNYFSDVPLLNQHGEKMRFYSDLLKGKTVVINSFFTSCVSVCPPMNQRLAKLQEAMGDRFGKDVIFLSISVDPLNDTPEKLHSYAERFHAKPGWYFLTGKKENVDWALYKIGQYVEGKDDHTTVWVIGNESKGVWNKALGLAPVAELRKIIEDTLAEQ